MTRYEGMKINVDGIFTSTPKNVYMTLAQKNGYYIPSYQRPYAWDADAKTNMNDLFNSIKEGMFSDDLSALVFFGAIVLVEDNNGNLDIEPCDPRSMPSQVSVVVDGQQRLTTFTLVAARLYQRLHQINKKLKEDKRYFEKLDDDKLIDKAQIVGIYNDLSACIGTATGATVEVCRIRMAESSFEDNPYGFYPRIIRMYDDCWSTAQTKASYTSDVASYLFELRPTDRGYNGALKDLFKSIDSEIKETVHSDEMILAFDSEDSHLRAYLQGFDLVQIVDDSLALKGEKYALLKEAAALLYLTDFILYRCAFTVISVTKNSYSHNIFQALNTTGEPLNAIDTFKPEVIRYVGHQAYQHSAEYQLFEAIQALLNAKPNKTKPKLLEALIADFGYIFTGGASKVNKSLKAQRQFLIEQYLAIDPDAREAKTQFVQTIHDHLMFGYAFINHKKVSENFVYDGLLPQDALLLNFLKENEWNIVRPLISALRLNSQHDFKEGIRALAAFIVLAKLRVVNAPIKTMLDAFWRECIGNINATTLKSYLQSKAKEDAWELAEQTLWQQRVAHNDILDVTKLRGVAKLAILSSFNDAQLMCLDAYSLLKLPEEKSTANSDHRFEMTQMEQKNKNAPNRWSNVTVVPLDLETHWLPQEGIGQGQENYQHLLQQVGEDACYVSYLKGETAFSDKRLQLEQCIKNHLFDKFACYNKAKEIAKDTIEKEELQAEVWLSNVYTTFSRMLWIDVHIDNAQEVEAESYV
ncbi:MULTISPECIES: DUF262 domain-containing protein [Cysteiniphilum]|uniref:GmrSD restriction endonucleases N-terminal domain-containing protein n=1 Tax=Cysteiniphilum litorale TaxID=2056700 RepID=A0A8J2Z4W0_9GAMM|nr:MULTISPECIES: DUF262 domain-containing protein [Cysteiniphilum]GGF99555.1 hypothetical protein GCM10010995_16040 [Cysteiniphilum litorale]